MAKLDILIYPDERLKMTAKEVTKFDQELHKFLDNMAETMYSAQGVGLAATQVGDMRRVLVMDVSKDGSELIEVINPRIVTKSGKLSYEEGCLSIPGYRDHVDRSKALCVEFLDRDGKEHRIECTDLPAVCLQHEIDHLDGVLFVDRLSRLKRAMFKRWLKKQQTEADSDD